MSKSLLLLRLLPALWLCSISAQQPSPANPVPSSPSALGPSALSLLKEPNPGPSDRNAIKIYAKASKDFDANKYSPALEGLRKADQADSGHCVSCETLAYLAALRMENFSSAHEETALLLKNVTSPEGKAQVHSMIGDLYLAEGGYRILEQPFRDADAEYKAALELRPATPDCVYRDGLALAHLNQLPKARERFQQFMKLAPANDPQLARAKLFAAQPELARKRVAPFFQLQTLDGKTISMENMAGKVVLIDFWATWCGPCKNALPHLKEIAHKFEGQPLIVVSISLDPDDANWRKFVAQNAMTWNQYRDGGFDGPIATQFNVKAIPTTLTIDADGFVQDRQVGDGQIEKKLEELIAKAQQQTDQKADSASPKPN